MTNDEEILAPMEETAPAEEPTPLEEPAPEDGGPGLAKTTWESEGVPDEVLLSRIESIVFVSPEPVTLRRLGRILSLDGKRVRDLVSALDERYRNRGIVLQEVSGGLQFRSHPDNAAIVRDVFKVRPLRMSRAALETLAVIAYRQPITRAEVEQIRGVDCGGVLKFLFEKDILRIIGRKEEPGRPIIYGTSQSFLELFGLKSLADLPALHEFTDLWEEHQELVDAETPLEGRETAPAAEPISPAEPVVQAEPPDSDVAAADPDPDEAPR